MTSTRPADRLRRHRPGAPTDQPEPRGPGRCGGPPGEPGAGSPPTAGPGPDSDTEVQPVPTPHGPGAPDRPDAAPSRTREPSAQEPAGPDPTAAGAAGDQQGPGAGRWRRVGAALRHAPWARDVAAALLYVLYAGWLTAGLWPDPGARVLALNPEDQVLYEWFLAYDSRLLAGDFWLVSDRLNAPEGVNLLANTSVVTLGFLLAPVTVAFGAPVTFAVLALASLAGTAAAWYLLLARVLRLRRGAALAGGALCGFAPGMVSQNNSHLHMTVQVLVPVLVWLVIRMARAAEAGRGHARGLYGSALGLAAVIVVQVFIGEEVLFLTAITLAVFTLAYAAARPRYAWRVAPRFAAGLLLAAVVSGTALAYPLWLQFAGPQSVANGVFSPHYFSADLASFAAISPQSIGGRPEAAALAPGVAEHNTFFGWLLLAAAGTAAVCLIRRPAVLAASVSALVMAGLSLGPEIRLSGEPTGWTGPYQLLLGVPVVDGALPTRFALAVVPLLALVLAVAVDRALRSPHRTVRICIPVAVAAALLPISPRPMVTAPRQPLPEFITAGHWRQCAPPGTTLVPVPLPTPPKPWAMRWAAATHVEFALPEGFFIGPYGADGTGSMGVYSQPTSVLLTKVVETGETPPVSESEQAQARQDLAHWRASCVVLTDDAPHAVQVRITLEALLGPGQRVADVWTWRVGG